MGLSSISKSINFATDFNMADSKTLSQVRQDLRIKWYRSPIDNRPHRYFPDFIIKTDKNKKMLIEIKPSRQLDRPKPPKRKTKSYMRESFEFIKNKAKWSAATKYAEDNGAVFKIITEKDLGIKF